MRARVDLAGLTPRISAHLVLAALPLLAITAHVAGLVAMNVTAGVIVLPMAGVLLVLGLFAPVPEEKLVLAGIRWGIVATAVYDAARLDTAYLLGMWGDFIPTVGTWVLDIDPDRRVLGAIAGYVWRYGGDGAGLGVVFFLGAAATGLRERGRGVTVAAAVLFACGPTWGGLIATVGLPPRGQALMFPLTPTTIALSLGGHVIFGVVLGLAAWRAPDLETHWSGPRLVDLAPDPDTATVGVGVGVGARPRLPLPPAGFPRPAAAGPVAALAGEAARAVAPRRPRAPSSLPPAGLPAPGRPTARLPVPDPPIGAGVAAGSERAGGYASIR